MGRKKEKLGVRYGHIMTRTKRCLSLFPVEDLESLDGKLSSTPLNLRKPVDIGSFSHTLPLPFPNLVVSMPHPPLPAHLCIYSRLCYAFVLLPSITCPVGAYLYHIEPGDSHMGCCCTLYERHVYQVSLPRISSLCKKNALCWRRFYIYKDWPIFL